MSGFAVCAGARIPRGYAVERRCSRVLSVPPGREPWHQQAEGEPANVGEERHAAPRFAETLNSPELASMSLYKDHSPRKIQAGIRTRKIGKTHVRIRDPG